MDALSIRSARRVGSRLVCRRTISRSWAQMRSQVPSSRHWRMEEEEMVGHGPDWRGTRRTRYRLATAAQDREGSACGCDGLQGYAALMAPSRRLGAGVTSCWIPKVLSSGQRSRSRSMCMIATESASGLITGTPVPYNDGRPIAAIWYWNWSSLLGG